MKVTRKDIDALNAVVTVAIDQEDIAPKIETILLDYKKRANIPGFRKGHVPLGLIKKQYGMAVRVEETNKLLQESLTKFLNDENISILGNPLPKAKENINWEADTLNFDFELGLTPKFEVKLKGRKALTHYLVEADEKMINEQLERMQSQYGSLKSAERVSPGIEITATFKNDEEAIDKKATFSFDDVKGRKNKSVFEKSSIGETITLKTKNLFSDDQKLVQALGIEQKKALGLDVEVSVTLEEFNERILADLDQELFDKIFGKDSVKTVTEFKAKLKEDAESQFVTQSEQKLLNDVTEYLIDETKFDLPSEFLKKWMQTAGENSVTKEEAAAEYEKSERGLRYQLIESKLIEKFEMQLKKEEIQDFAKDMIRKQMLQYGRADIEHKELEDIAQRILSNKDEVKRISDQLMSQKMINLFKNEANLKSKKVSYENFIKEAYNQ